MIIKKLSKEKTISSKSCSEHAVSGILKKTGASKKLITLSFLALLFLSGCSSFGQKVANARDALKTDVQTQHDENFRLKKIRKALLAGNLSEAEKQWDTLYAPHWKCIGAIEIAAATYSTNKVQALETIKKVTEEIWNLSDANQRAMALLALLKFELETKRDISKAKETIKQIEKTIVFISDDKPQRVRRYGELQTLLEKYNPFLSR